MTAFVITTVSSLQPDYGQITVILLLEQAKILRAAGNVTEINAISPSHVNLESISPGTNDLWINGLFFTSLSLSLATALLSVLVKQWLQAYGAMSSGNARERALIHQFRFSGLKKWKVPEIIGILPLILHASLALFFVGLSLYVAELHSSLCWIVVAITALAFTIYLGSILIPQIWLECPYRIPLLFIPTKFLLQPFRVAKWVCCKFLKRLRFFKRLQVIKNNMTYPAFSKLSLEKSEFEYLNSGGITDHALANIIVWLHTLQSNQSIKRIVAQSLNGILQTVYHRSLPLYYTVLSPHLQSISRTMWSALVGLEENDRYGCEIWSSIISLWMKVNSMGIGPWPIIDVTMAKDALMNSIKSNRKVALKLIIELSKDRYSTLGRINDLYPSALHDAAMHGHLEVVEMVVANGENVNVQEGFYGTALQAAAYRKHVDVVKFLVEKGADTNVQGGQFGTALKAAAYSEDMDIVKFLVNKGAYINVRGGNFGTALQIAARSGDPDIIKFLVENGADVNVKGGNFGTALQAAAKFGNPKIVKYLVEKGADVNIQGGIYETALQAAAFSGNLETVTYLVENGADVNIEGGRFGSALQAAKDENQADIAQYLKDHGAK